MTDAERVRRLLDGELDDLEAAALLAEAERTPALAAELEAAAALHSSLAELRAADDVRPPTDLVDRSVRRAVLERAREDAATSHGAAQLTRWLVRPLAFRARPAALLLAAAAVWLLALGGARWSARRAASQEPREAVAPTVAVVAPPSARGPSDAAPLEVPVRFVLPASGAHSVVVAGDFNEWRTDATPLVDDDGDGVFVGTVSLARGTYDYMFVVDGERWVPDPYASQYHDDGFGQRNAVLRLD